MSLIYGFLVLAVGFSVYKAGNIAAIKVFSVIFLGWIIYVNFHPYITSYSQAFNLVLDVSLLACVLVIRKFHDNLIERRGIDWVSGLFLAMITTHIMSMFANMPSLVYYTIGNGLFLAQLISIHLLARKAVGLKRSAKRVYRAQDQYA